MAEMARRWLVWSAATLLLMGALARVGGLGQDWALMQHPPLLLPGGEHWLGTSLWGQDLGARWLQALGQVWSGALPAALIAVLVALMVAWLAAGHGMLSAVARSGMDLMDCVPTLLVLLALGFVLKGMPTAGLLVLGLCLWPESVRVLERGLRVLRHSAWWQQRSLLGAGWSQGGWRHWGPHLWNLLLPQVLLMGMLALKAEVLLQFLGAGSSQSVSLGSLLVEGLAATGQGAWWPLLLPCCTLVWLWSGLLAARRAAPVSRME